MNATATNAFHIKLGLAGAWERECITQQRIRIAFVEIPRQMIVRKHWAKIAECYLAAGKTKSVATLYANQIKTFSESSEADIWISFFNGNLWWTRIGGETLEDETSFYRNCVQPWSNVDGNKNLLDIQSLPGKLAKIQQTRGTLCKVKERETLLRVINAVQSNLALEIEHHAKVLSNSLKDAIIQLHPKDFETLVDLLCSRSNLRRVGILGENVKDIDLLLEEPISR